MKARDIVALVGGFFTAFGSVILTSEVPPWAWWIGKAMVILGPLLMTARAMMAGRADPEVEAKLLPRAPKD